jgi:hypothetical protein
MTPDGRVRLAEHRHPPVEQVVVQRRVAVVPQRTADVAERLLGDGDGERLVEPHGRAGHEAQHHARSHHHDEACEVGDAQPATGSGERAAGGIGALVGGRLRAVLVHHHLGFVHDHGRKQ